MKGLLPKFTAAGVLLILIFAAFLFFPGGVDRPSATLPDGSVLTLEFAGFRSPQERPAPMVWLRQLPIFPVRPWHQSWWHEGLNFWVTLREKGTGRCLNFDWWSRAVAMDEDGCQFPDSNHSIHWDRSSSTGSRVLPAAPPGVKSIVAHGVLTTFPRRQKEFTLRFFNQQGQAVADLKVPNPLYRQYPAWHPEPLPVSATNRDLVVTLVQLTNSTRVSIEDGIQAERPSLAPAFRVTYQGHPSEEWQASRIFVEDATGNQSSASDYTLCRHEAAWKIRADFFRKPTAQFASNELWTLAGMAVPPAGQARPLLLTNRVGGVQLELYSIAGPGTRIDYSNGIPISVSASTIGSGTSMSARGAYQAGKTILFLTSEVGEPNVLVRVAGTTEGRQVSLQVADAKGKGPYLEASPSGGVNDYRVYRLGGGAANVSTVDLRFIVEKRRVVELVVRPPELPAEDLDFGTIERAQLAKRLPARDPKAGPSLIDLAPYYTALLTDSLFANGPIINGSSGRSVIRSAVPLGVQKLAGTLFDVRGVIQLSGLSIKGQGSIHFPKRVLGIPIGRKCQQLDFLQGAIWSVADGTETGQYVLYYADGKRNVQPIIYGRDVRDWSWASSQQNGTGTETPAASGAEIAWPTEGADPVSAQGLLFKFTWKNPRPEIAIEKLDFISSMTSCAPFLIGITAEP